MKKKSAGILLLVMVGLFIGAVSDIMAASGTVDPSQLAKIKKGMTEAEVKAILGEPSKVEEEMKPRGGGREFFEVRILSYGPEGGADLIFINKKNGKVGKVIPH